MSIKKVWKRCGGNRRKEKNTVPDTAGGMRNPADCLIIIAKGEGDWQDKNKHVILRTKER